jgi:simple sugar transport system permease protein
MTTSLAGPPAPEELVVEHRVVEPPVPTTRRIISGASIVLAGIITIFGWGIGANSGDAAFSLSNSTSRFNIPDIHVPAQAASVVMGLIICALGAYQLIRGFSRRAMKWVLTAVAVLFVVSFLCWAGTGTQGTIIDVVGILQNTLFNSTPLILGAMAGIMCERTGVINVAIEGQMLAGAWAGALGATVANNLGVGIAASILAGGLMGALLAVFSIKFFVNQVVLGVVLNALALGLTGYGFDALMQNNPNRYNNPAVLNQIKIPILVDIPVIGQPLFDANIIVYAMYVIIIAIDIGLFRTRWGLRTRSVGEHPRAADTVGINVLRKRYVNVILGGFIAGLAGATLTIGGSGAFTKSPTGMTSGRGFIALAAVIFGRWNPRGATLAALLFGFTLQLQTLLSVIGTPVKIPANFLLMLPYLVTIFAVAGLVGRSQPPAADGEPYVKS